MTEWTPPPAEEPRGYHSAPGFVKLNPANNQHYLDQMTDDPWWPAIKECAEKLEGVIPGYNISQIKSKFGGLRFYIDKGDCADDVWLSGQDTANAIILRAEIKVYHFEGTGIWI